MHDHCRHRECAGEMRPGSAVGTVLQILGRHACRPTPPPPRFTPRSQMATALYFIDKLALRAGHEKDEDEADTVGCCTLKVGEGLGDRGLLRARPAQVLHGGDVTPPPPPLPSPSSTCLCAGRERGVHFSCAHQV